jgi:hypothetical protein
VQLSKKLVGLSNTSPKLRLFVLILQEDEPVIYPAGLLFLLEDYVAKLDHCLPSTVKRISSLATTQQVASVRYASLDRIPTPLIARRAMKLLTYILSKLEVTAEYCQVNII